MLKRIIQLAGGLFLAFAALSVIFLVGMRLKYAPVTTAVRRFNRAVTNPRAMKTAGEPGAMASAIRHVGRTSGTPYETPIGPVETDDGVRRSVAIRIESRLAEERAGRGVRRHRP